MTTITRWTTGPAPTTHPTVAAGIAAAQRDARNTPRGNVVLAARLWRVLSERLSVGDVVVLQGAPGQESCISMECGLLETAEKVRAVLAQGQGVIRTAVHPSADAWRVFADVIAD